MYTTLWVPLYSRANTWYPMQVIPKEECTRVRQVSPYNMNSVYVYLIRKIHVYFGLVFVQCYHQTVYQHLSSDKTDRVKKVRRNEKPCSPKPKKPKGGDLTSSMHRL